MRFPAPILERGQYRTSETSQTFSRPTISPENHLLTVPRKFFDKELTPHLLRWEQEGICDRGFWNACGDAGLLWVLARDRSLQPNTYAAILAELNAKSIATDKLAFVPQPTG
jgi:hypothetical protein